MFVLLSVPDIVMVGDIGNAPLSLIGLMISFLISRSIMGSMTLETRSTVLH